MNLSDTLGHRAKIGIIVPSTNTVVQPELDDMRPVGVTNHVARMAIANTPLRSNADFEALVAALLKSQDAAIESVMSCAPDHLVLGLSTETFWDGADAGRRATDSLRAALGVGVSAAADALVDLLHESGLRRIAILTPYQPVGDDRTTGFFTQSGFDVVRTVGLRCGSPVETAMVPRRQLIAALHELADAKPEAIVQVGTNLPMAGLAREACDWLGLPVLAANTVLYRHALKALGLLEADNFRNMFMGWTAPGAGER